MEQYAFLSHLNASLVEVIIVEAGKIAYIGYATLFGK